MMLSFSLFLAAAPIAVLTASSTTPAPAACLLDKSCTWTGGVDEGLGFRFAAPLPCDVLEVEVKKLAPKSVLTTAPIAVSFGAYSLPLTTTDGGKTWQTRCVPSDAIFIRVAPEAGPAPVQLAGVRFLKAKQPLELTLPTSVRADATASSVLAPVSAYQPAFLFDSKLDLAWATDGKKSNGKGESVRVSFAEPVSIAGLVVWNGYQRSPTHFMANGRVNKLTVKAGDKQATVALSTGEAPQRLRFEAPLPAAQTVEVVIDDVVAGGKYKDVVVSELRFVDAAGRIIAPMIAPRIPAAPPALKPVMDTSYAGIVAAVDGDAMSECVERRLRVRSDGSFVIRTGGGEPPFGDGVIEGGWEPSKDGVRIFGKKYRTIVTQGEYDPSTEIVPEIFQSDFALVPFATLSAAEQKRIVQVVTDVTSVGEGAAPSKPRTAYARDGSVLAKGATAAAMREALVQALVEKKALAAKSSVYTDVLVPTSGAGPCAR